jgi:hypothetical protein
MRTRNLDLWRWHVSTVDDASSVASVRDQLEQHIKTSVRRYEELQEAMAQLVQTGVDDADCESCSNFATTWHPLLVDKSWPGVRALQEAHKTVLVWLADFGEPTANVLEVLAWLHRQCATTLSELAKPNAANLPSDLRSMRNLARALTYLLYDFRITRIIV